MLLDNPAPAKQAPAAPPRKKHTRNLKGRRQLGDAGLRPPPCGGAGTDPAAVRAMAAAWTTYARQLLAPPTPRGSREWCERVRGAALPGCLVTVVAARQPRLVGVQGTVLREVGAGDAVHVVTGAGRTVTVPLKGSVLRYRLPPEGANPSGEGAAVTLVGNNLKASQKKGSGLSSSLGGLGSLGIS